MLATWLIQVVSGILRGSPRLWCVFNFQLFDDTGSTKRRFTGGREREQICRQVKVLSSQQRISPEGSQTDSQPKLEGQIYTQLSRVKH